jgi:chloramphenicol-sensitive protein RarD
LFGVAAYGLWGVFPIFFRLMAGISPLEVLAHRAWWSFVVLAGVIVVWRRGTAVVAVFRNRRTLATLMASTLLIAANWLTFIFAINVEQVVQAGLGYFVTPLANVLLGVVVLGEQLRRVQLIALLLAAVGVVVLTVHGGEVPWIALTLAVTFSLYGLMRKIAAADALVGLFVETMLLSPLALGYVAYLAIEGRSAFSLPLDDNSVILIASGPVTTVPLLCFAAAARRLRMTTLGFLQFLAPSLQVCVAIFLFHEPFTAAHAWAFPLIWAAVVLYLIDGLGLARTEPVSTCEPCDD